MTTTRRSMMWPLIIVIVGGLWLLMAAGVFEKSVKDLMIRAWPALLIILGLEVLLGGRRLRVARFMISTNLIVVGATLLLLVAVIWFAYARQADVLREDNQQMFAEIIPPDVGQIRVEIDVERTTVTIAPTQDDPRSISLEYKGSKENDVAINWSVEDGIGVLSLRETQRGSIPRLEDYGRGTLEIKLPPKVTIEQFQLSGEDGDVTFDMRPLPVQRVILVVDKGDFSLTLPENEALNGELKTGKGGIDLNVPLDIDMIVSLSSSSGVPAYEFDETRYDLLHNGTLKRENREDFQVGLVVSVKDGAPLVVSDLQ